MQVIVLLAALALSSMLLSPATRESVGPGARRGLSAKEADNLLDRMNKGQSPTLSEIRELVAAGYGRKAFEILRDKFHKYRDSAPLMAAADPDRALDLFKGWLDGKNALDRDMAALGLGDCEEGAIAPLVEAIGRQPADSPVETACSSLMHIGPAGLTALLKTMREHHDIQSLQWAGLQALGSTAIASPEAFDIARERLGDEKLSLQMREAALTATCHNARSAGEAIQLAAASAVQRDLFNCPKVLHEFGAAAYPTLLKMLDDPRPQARKVALQAIARPGPEALDQAKATFVSPITKLQAADPDRNVRRLAKTTLYQISTARNATTMREELEHRVAVFCDPHQPLEDRRQAGVWLILPPADADRFIPKFIAMLKDPDAILAGDACQTLGALGPHASPTVVRALFDATADPKVAEHARIAITGSGNGQDGLGAAALPVLEAALRGSDAGGKKRAMEMVPFFAGASRDRLEGAVNASRADAGDAKYRLRRVQLAANDSSGLAIVLPALADPDADIRREAQVRLERFNPNEQMLGTAQADLGADAVGVRRGAAEFIVRANWDDGRPTARFKQPTEQVTQTILRILTEALRDPRLDEADFEQVFQAFERLGPVAAGAVESLANDPNVQTRQRVCTLFHLSPHAGQLLTKAASDPSPEVRRAALLRLQASPGANAAPSVFITASRDADPMVRAEAASALLLLTQAGRAVDPAVLAALQQLSRDPDPIVRRVIQPDFPAETQPAIPETAPAQTQPSSRGKRN